MPSEGLVLSPHRTAFPNTHTTNYSTMKEIGNAVAVTQIKQKRRGCFELGGGTGSGHSCLTPGSPEHTVMSS